MESCHGSYFILSIKNINETNFFLKKAKSKNVISQIENFTCTFLRLVINVRKQSYIHTRNIIQTIPCYNLWFLLYFHSHNHCLNCLPIFFFYFVIKQGPMESSQDRSFPPCPLPASCLWKNCSLPRLPLSHESVAQEPTIEKMRTCSDKSIS